MQIPDDLAPKKGGTSYYSFDDDSNNNSGSSKQPSKHKRRQMKRALATGGMLGGLQKLEASHKPEAWCRWWEIKGKTAGSRENQIVWTNLLLTLRFKTFLCRQRRGRSRNLCLIIRPTFFAQHRAGKLMTVSDVANRVHSMSRKPESTSPFGILLEMPSSDTLQLLRSSDSGTVMFVLNKKPDSHLHGATRISKLHDEPPQRGKLTK